MDFVKKQYRYISIQVGQSVKTWITSKNDRGDITTDHLDIKIIKETCNFMPINLTT